MTSESKGPIDGTMSSDTKKAPCHASPADIGISPYSSPQENRKVPARRAKRTNKKSQNNSILSNILTCLQVKSLLETRTGSSKGITVCMHCGSFELEHFTIKKLQHLKDNNPRTGVSIPRHLRCHTWWIEKNATSVSPSSPSSYSSSPTGPSPNPPILSTLHSMESPLQENRPIRTTANYSGLVVGLRFRPIKMKRMVYQVARRTVETRETKSRRTRRRRPPPFLMLHRHLQVLLKHPTTTN